jgi:hypothetical protein
MGFKVADIVEKEKWQKNQESGWPAHSTPVPAQHLQKKHEEGKAGQAAKAGRR